VCEDITLLPPVQPLQLRICVVPLTLHGQCCSMCNVPANSHAWKSPAQSNPGFVCGKVIGGPTFHGNLGSKNSVAAAQYEFQYSLLPKTSGSYPTEMKAACKKLGTSSVIFLVP
jgi:hypothetical protein